MSTVGTWWGDAESKPAPDALQPVQSLVNTLELERHRDRLAAHDEGDPWLVLHGFAEPTATISDDDLRIAREFREALRELVIQNTDSTPPDGAGTAALHSIAADVALRASVGADGLVDVAPVDDSVRARLAGLLLVVQAAQRDGTWTHLKACGNEDCRWAFYDRSRNHGGTWCDMATCGNKLKNRDFRARQRALG